MVKWLLLLGEDIKIREVPREVLEGLQEKLFLFSPKAVSDKY
jgi:hypothetical protein